MLNIDTLKQEKNRMVKYYGDIHSANREKNEDKKKKLFCQLRDTIDKEQDYIKASLYQLLKSDESKKELDRRLDDWTFFKDLDTSEENLDIHTLNKMYGNLNSYRELSIVVKTVLETKDMSQTESFVKKAIENGVGEYFNQMLCDALWVAQAEGINVKGEEDYISRPTTTEAESKKAEDGRGGMGDNN